MHERKVCPCGNENCQENDHYFWPDNNLVCSHCGGVGHTIGAHF